MPHEATLLPPPPSLDDDDDLEHPSTRRLDDVGAVAVLGAMIEQRRKSQPSFDAITESEAPRAATQSGITACGDGRSGPIRRHSEGFLKVR